MEHVVRTLARCLANVAMPAARKVVADYPVDREVEGISGRRTSSDLTPSGLIVDGRDSDVPESPRE
jgi:hypothetical protein